MDLSTRASSSCLECRAALELARALTAGTGLSWRAARSCRQGEHGLTEVFVQNFDNRSNSENGWKPAAKRIVLGIKGRPEIDTLIASAKAEGELDWAGDEGYVIAAVGPESAASAESAEGAEGRLTLVVAANSAHGVLYGAVRTASLAGTRFYLSRESKPIPGPISDPLRLAFRRPHEPWPAFCLAERPRFARRGALPWFNFLSGPTAWDQEDWAVYVDHLARSRANMLGFHVYTGGLERYYPYVEPFIQIEADGVLPEAELDTTETARWGYRPLSTRLFAAGTSLLFPQPVFGSEVAIPRGDLRSRYERAQALLAWVMKRARSWGIRPFIGFEAGIVPPEVHSLIPPDARLPSGELDPFHPAAQRIFHRTLEHIAATYPDLEAIWLFQHEHVLYARIPPKGRAAFEAYCSERQEAFPELPEETRWKGPWLLAWVESAWRWKERHAPHLKLAVSGWGGGTQFPRLIPGLDRTMPKDVVIAALIPGQGEGSLPEELVNVTGRERIAVPWWEGDAQLWHPQPRVESLLKQHDDFAARGISGTVGLHWRTQDVEANAWAFFESCWESRLTGAVSERIDLPGRSAASCYIDYAAHGLGLGEGEAAAETGTLLYRSEKERWFQGAFSPVYFGYTSQWGRLKPGQREVIERGLARIVELGASAKSPPSPAFDHLVHSWRFVLHLDAWSRAIEEAEHALEAGDAPRAFAALAQAPAREALHAFAARVMTQGDRGALASVNQRVWLTHRALLARCAEGIGRTALPQAASPHSSDTTAWSVALPVRAFWDAASGDRGTWRVLTGSLDAAAAFLAVDDGNTTRRFPMEQTGPGAFALVLPASAFSWTASEIVKVRVEVLFFGNPELRVPKAGELTLALFRESPETGSK